MKNKKFLYKIKSFKYGSLEASYLYCLLDNDRILLTGPNPCAASLVFGRNSIIEHNSIGITKIKLLQLSSLAFEINPEDGKITCIKNRYGLTDDDSVLKEALHFYTIQEATIFAATRGWPEPIVVDRTE